MEFANQFHVPLPLAEAWKLMLDVPRILPCLPGARLLETMEGNRYRGSVAVKLGPVKLSFDGQAELVRVDEQAHVAWLKGSGMDAKGRGGSQSMVDEVHEGSLLPTLPWANLFELNPSASAYIFVAGGIGITPIMSMMRQLQSQGLDNYTLYYCTRDAASTAFLEELKGSEFTGRVKLHHDQGDSAKVLDLWPIFERPSSAHVYCCGPQGLMDSVRDMTGHWPTERIHFESFGVGQTDMQDNQGFDVVLQKSGTRVTVPPHQSILEALRADGHVVPSSCESGTCGSCRTPLLAGEAEHRDLVLRPDEHAHHIMVCVSRAKSNELVLDL